MKLSIAHLRAAGVSDKLIVDAMAEAQAERREQNRIAQRNHRSRQQKRADRADRADRHIDTSLLPSLEKKESKKVGKISIATDWKLTSADCDYARGKGWPDERITTEGERFHNHYLANGEARKSWPACWRNWVTSKYQNGNGGQHNGRAGRPAPKDDPRSIRGAFDRLFEKLNRTDEVGQLPREADFRVIPGGRRE